MNMLRIDAIEQYGRRDTVDIQGRGFWLLRRFWFLLLLYCFFLPIDASNSNILRSGPCRESFLYFLAESRHFKSSVGVD